MELKAKYTYAEVKGFFLFLVAIDIFLFLFYIVINILFPNMHWGPLRGIFDLDGDACIPAWYSSIKLFLISLVGFLAYKNNKNKEIISTLFLLFGFLFFLYLSADEGALLHENITNVVKRFKISWPLFNGNHGAWITVYMIALIIILYVARSQIYNLFKYFRFETNLAILGFIIIGLGGVFLEIISYYYLRSGLTPNLYKIEVAFEELFELLGISFILYSSLLFNLHNSTHLSNSISKDFFPKRSVKSGIRKPKLDYI